MDPSNSPERSGGLGRAIAVRRTELGLKRKELAERASLSYPYVSELEKGAKEPSQRALRQLADALKLTPIQLLERGESFDFILEDPSSGRTVVGELKTSARPISATTAESQLASLITALQVPGASSESPGPGDVEALVARLVRQRLEEFIRDELPALVTAELHRALTNALQQDGRR